MSKTCIKIIKKLESVFFFFFFHEICGKKKVFRGTLCCGLTSKTSGGIMLTTSCLLMLPQLVSAIKKLWSLE